MLTEGRSVVALVRSLEDLGRACRELAGLFSALRQRGMPAAAAERLLGIWIDGQGAVELPDVLALGTSAQASRPARIVEATGASGIWMLYFLETPPGTVSRADLLGALARASTNGGDDPMPGRFIPVFACDTPARSVRVEIERLQQHHSGLLLAPLYQDPGTGELDFLLEPPSPPKPAFQRAELH